ncbi:MAG: DUF488 domain-containing protein [Pseudomonadota bacterium]|nr:MAG: DUF488 domain-containing protein [Pseudomonadota bacterium]
MARTATASLRVKRVYDPPSPSDGYRILVDRVWPRGLSKEAIRLDRWCKDVAPSTSLRKWFGHDPEKWAAFQERYFAELDAHPEALEELVEACRGTTVTLLFGAKDAEHNNAVALKTYLEQRARRARPRLRRTMKAATARKTAAKRPSSTSTTPARPLGQSKPTKSRRR